MIEPLPDPEAVLLPTVLVADDDPDLVSLVARRLGRAGYRVVTACDGAEAVEKAAQFLPQVAVLDVMMPKLTGYEVIAHLRAQAETRDIVTILISAGLPDMEGYSKLLVEADDYIKKPFGPHELTNCVRAALSRKARDESALALQAHLRIGDDLRGGE